MSAATNYLEEQIIQAKFRSTPWTQRANSTVYAAGDRVYAATFDGNVYECITGGTSAASPPTFNTNLGDTTTDGSVTWLTLKMGLPKRPIFIALFTAAPGEAGGGTETTYTNYARIAVAPSDSNWAAPSAGNGLTSNVNAINFAAPGSAATLTHMATMDRLTGGNMEVYAALAASQAVTNGGAAPSFAANALTITVA